MIQVTCNVMGCTSDSTHVSIINHKSLHLFVYICTEHSKALPACASREEYTDNEITKPGVP